MILYGNLLIRCFLVPLYSAGWISGFLSINLSPASICNIKSCPKPFPLSSYHENASLKSSSASGLIMTLYFIFYSLFFYKHHPTESLIRGFCDKPPIFHQLSFSPLRLVRLIRFFLLSYPK